MGSLEGLCGQCLNLVPVVQATYSTVVMTLLNGMLVHRRYLPKNVGTPSRLSRMRLMNEIALKSFKIEPRVMSSIS